MKASRSWQTQVPFMTRRLQEEDSGYSFSPKRPSSSPTSNMNAEVNKYNFLYRWKNNNNNLPISCYLSFFILLRIFFLFADNWVWLEYTFCLLSWTFFLSKQNRIDVIEKTRHSAIEVPSPSAGQVWKETNIWSALL